MAAGLAIAAIAGLFHLRLEHDVLAFLPRRDDDVRRAVDIARRFDALHPVADDTYRRVAEHAVVYVPIALVAMLVALVALLRKTAVVVVACVVWATLVVTGALGWLGVAWTPALTMLPVFVLGASALFVRASPYVALSCAAGFASLAVTDIAPLRMFAIAGAVAIALTWVALRIFATDDAPSFSIAFVARHRLVIVALVIVPMFFFIAPLRHLTVHSKPWAAAVDVADPDVVLDLDVHGDLLQPTTLRALAHVADYASTLPGVSNVESIVDPIVAANHGLGDGYRLPISTADAQRLFTMLPDQPLVTRDRQDTLVRVHVGEQEDAVTRALEARASALHSAHWPSRAEATEELGLVFQRPGVALPDRQALDRVADQLELPGPDDTQLQTLRERATLDAIMSGSAPALHQDQKAKTELAVERQSDGWQLLWKKAALRPAEVDVAAAALTEKLAALPRAIAQERAMRVLVEAAKTGDLPVEVQHHVERVVDDLLAPPARVEPTPLSATVGGEPILRRGLDRAVRFLLRTSLLVVLGAIALLALLALRSTRAILCVVVPGVAIVYVLGGVAVAKVPIDLGVALVPAIVIGFGAALQLVARPAKIAPLIVGLFVLSGVAYPFLLAGVALSLMALLAIAFAPRSEAQTT